jgi:acetyl esterase/lipase
VSSIFLLRLAFDLTAASLLLIGFAYWWLGNVVHEVVGTAMFLLLVVHNIFNRRWYGTVRRTREPRGVINVAFTFLLMAGMLALLVTSVLISNTLAPFMPPWGGFTVRQIHTFAAYWVLVIVAIHLGLRWPLIMGFTRSLLGISRPSRARTLVLRVLAASVAMLGVWSSSSLGIGTKLAMQVTLDWWNFEESVASFFIHCIAIAGLYMALTYYTTNWIQRRQRRAQPSASAARSPTGEIKRAPMHGRPTGLALLLLAFSSGAPESNIARAQDRVVEIAQQQPEQAKGAHLTTDSRIRDLLNHPAFRGFGRLLLPWDNRTYDESLRLSDVGSLLPYHTHVDPATVVNGLNRMVDDASSGTPVFYDFYTEAQKAEQPAKRHAGLFFFRGRPGAPFAIIAPGGGFSYVGAVHEGFPYAAAISKQGYNAFVLKYRAGQGGAVATQDLAAALSYILRHAEALGVSTQRYSLWGSSAGARMVAAIGSHGAAGHGGKQLPKPSTVVMAYTAHSDHSAHEPPTFVVVGENDSIAPPSSMERRLAALRSAGTEVAYRKYKNVGHGFGPGTGTSAEGWIDDAVRFWEKFMNAKAAQ